MSTPTDVCRNCGLHIFGAKFDVSRSDTGERFCTLKCMSEYIWNEYIKRANYKPRKMEEKK